MRPMKIENKEYEEVAPQSQEKSKIALSRIANLGKNNESHNSMQFDSVRMPKTQGFVDKNTSPFARKNEFSSRNT